MLTRRTLLTGGLLTGTAAGARPFSSAAAEAEQSSRGGSGNTDERMVAVLEEIRDQMRLDSGANVPLLDTIRSLQREFLKGHGKFPDFVDVGIEVWDALMNWAVRTRQVPQVTRTADGRYTVPLFQTNVVLRHDVGNNYIGQPYDAK